MTNPAARAYRATISYDGSAYFGWQRQPNRPTVQGQIEQALLKITGQEISVIGSGRTDTGVHALGQVIRFSVATRLDLDTLRRAIDANLPPDISIRDVAYTTKAFHPVRDAIHKRYRYIIQAGTHRDVLARNLEWWMPRPLDPDAMRQGAQHLQGEHDFAALQTAGSKRATTVRTIHEITVEQESAQVWTKTVIEVQANGFLYNMVRNIVGTLVLVGHGERSPAWVAEVIQSRDRRMAGPTAPPQGLFLVSVEYPSDEEAPESGTELTS